jgi:uncharacterized membrane protein YkoI
MASLLRPMMFLSSSPWESFAATLESENDQTSHDDRGRRRGRGRDDSSQCGYDRNSSNSSSNRSVSEISLSETRRLALDPVSGTAFNEKFEVKRGRSTYDSYIRKQSGEPYEVHVDAESGKVTKMERRSKS